MSSKNDGFLEEWGRVYDEARQKDEDAEKALKEKRHELNLPEESTLQGA